MPHHPNVLFILSDEWRGQAFGFAGDPNVATPHCDRLAAESWRFDTAVSNCPVCSPMRASLLTGLYPDRHGVFTNDVHLDQRFTSLADCFDVAGYRTAWIGKWHVDGHGRAAYIPPERRLRFGYFEGLECEHGYNASKYYLQDDPTCRVYDGYDACAQTDSAIRFMAEASDRPFCCCLSWGPPHFPYETAPEAYRSLYDADQLAIRPNIPPEMEAEARRDLAGYYAHCTALDDCTARLLAFLDERGLADDTLVVFTSDHGDLLGSQGKIHKQKPWDESILVPLLIRPPRRWDAAPRRIAAPVGLIDLLPTLCGLAAVPAPALAQGRDLGDRLRAGDDIAEQAQVIASYAMFGEYEERRGGRVYRGLRTSTHTYARDLDGPWLLYDNHTDPHQLHNLIDDPRHAALRTRLDHLLYERLDAIGDRFLDHQAMHDRWGWRTNANGTVPYGGPSGHGPSPVAAERFRAHLDWPEA